MRGAIVLFIILISTAQALAAACVSYQDCPVMDCVGFIRQCTDNSCKTSQCLVPDTGSIKNREDVPSFEDAVRPYERGINLSVRTRNPSAMHNSLLGSLGIQDVLMIMLKVVGFFFLALFAALLFTFAKSKGLAKYVAIIGLLVAAAIGFLIISKTFSTDSWSSMTASGIIDGQSLSNEQMQILSPRLVEAVHETKQMDIAEASIVVLELDSVSNLRTISLPLEGKNIRIRQEYIIEQKIGITLRHIFDEDRFIFIVTAEPDIIDKVTSDTVALFPSLPQKSRLFKTDNHPPEIIDFYPIPGSITNQNKISFSLYDNESGVDIKSLKSNIDTKLECSGTAVLYDCEILAQLPNGLTAVQIQVSDFEGNIKKGASEFTYDTEGAYMSSSRPMHESFTNSSMIYLDIKDRFGIASVYFEDTKLDCSYSDMSAECEFESYAVEGANILVIEVEDNAGNLNFIPLSFNYDDTAPQISTAQNSFNVLDKNLYSITINNEPYEISRCIKRDDLYTCTHDNINSVTATDAAGNTNQKINI